MLRIRCVVAGALVFALAPAAAFAQDLEPRAYSASPVGLKFVGVGYNLLTGSAAVDPDLPISDVQAHVQSFIVGAGRTFNLFGDLGLLTAVLPYSLADVTGNVFEQAQEVRRSGLANMRVKLSVNVRGNPAMTASEFAAAPRRTILGASVTASAPTGQYYSSKLVNLGTNRWGFKPEFGVSVPHGAWNADVYVGAWFYTENRSFFPGAATRTQDPVLTVQGHVSYQLQPRLWVAVDGTWYGGGSARVDAGDPSTALQNSRAGITLSVPVGACSVKLAASRGVTARAGGNFAALTAAWQLSWSSPR